MSQDPFLRERGGRERGNVGELSFPEDLELEEEFTQTLSGRGNVRSQIRDPEKKKQFWRS
jgi:hypothetical protein